MLWFRPAGKFRIAVVERGDDVTSVLGYLVKNESGKLVIEGDASGEEFEHVTDAASKLAGPNGPEYYAVPDPDSN
jgi:hypothetical protein